METLGDDFAKYFIYSQIWSYDFSSIKCLICQGEVY